MPGKQLELKQIVQQLRSFYHEYRRMPSFAEIGELLGYASKGAVRYVVDKLVEADVISKDAKGRLIPTSIFSGYPLLGSIAAGFPSAAEEELVDVITFDQFLVTNPQATFMIRVTGDSMIDAGIHPGDIVLIERGKTPRIGNIVAAEVDGAWTLKYFEKKGKKVSLRAANAKYPLIEPQSELRIGGVVIAVIRKY
jgi:repressor LexA